MRLFDLIFRGKSGQRPTRPAPRLTLLPSRSYSFEISGVSHYQDTLLRIVATNGDEAAKYECIAFLVPERNNPHDANEVAVHIEDEKVGYLSREDARAYREFLRLSPVRSPLSCDALIYRERKTHSGDGRVAVRLNLSWPPQLGRTP